MFIWGDFGTEGWTMEGANNHDNNKNKSTSYPKEELLKYKHL